MGYPLGLSVQVIAFMGVFIMALIIGPIIIPILRRLKIGQTVRDDGPATHLKKTGTPIMGGLIFLIPIFIVACFFGKEYPRLMPLALASLGFGFIGFIDDFIKVILKRKDGLYARQKTFGLVLVAAVFTVYVTYYSGLGTDMIIPFTGMNKTITLPVWFYIPIIIVFLYGFTNAVNLTDGVDGLCSGVTLIVMVFFTIIAMMRNEWDYVKVFSALVAGGCLGFLAFNMHPAKVFMGDSGSLGLGGAVSVISIVMKMPWILFIAGFIYLAEALSDIIQVGSYKLRGKRVFKMAPIHHHFELSGWKETKVVTVFWTITLIMCAVGFAALRLDLF